MRIIETDDDISEGVAALGARCPHLRRAAEVAGPLPLRRNPPGFASLMKIIVSQQVSVAAANGIWAKVEAAGATTPEAVLARDVEALRTLGLSRPKARYSQAIAAAVGDGSLDFEALKALDEAEAVKMLTAIKGIGQWTAEIYLMFCVGRADVFAPGDLALQEAAKLIFDLPDRPSAKALAEQAQDWSPWRAVAARLLWAYYGVSKGREGVTG